MKPHDALTMAGTFALDYVRRQCEEMRRHELTLRQGPNVEAVHDMRVAARRVRTAIRAFEPAIPPSLAALDGEVRWLGRVLGVARDLDVQIELFGEECGDQPLLQPLLDRLCEERHEAQRQILTALNSERYSRLIEDLFTGPQKETLESSEECACHAIENMCRQARHRTKGLDADSPAVDFHRLRKGVKRLRYVLEASEPVLGKRAADGVERLKELQDRLGKRQDAETAHQTYSRMLRLPDLPSNSAHAAEERLREWHYRERKHRRRALRCLDAIDESEKGVR